MSVAAVCPFLSPVNLVTGGQEGMSSCGHIHLLRSRAIQKQGLQTDPARRTSGSAPAPVSLKERKETR